MGMAKEVQVKDRKIKVRTITVGTMMKLQGEGRSRNLGDLMLRCLSDNDREFVESLDYEGDGSEPDIEKLLEAFKEVNPSFFQKRE